MKVLNIIIHNIPKPFKGLLYTALFSPLCAYFFNSFIEKKFTHIDWRMIFYTVVFIIVLLLISLFIGSINFIKNFNREGLNNIEIKNSVFIAAPMMAFYRKGNDSEYSSFRIHVIRIIDLLRIECSIKYNYYAGLDIKSQKEFETSDVSIKKNFKELQEKEYFILIYPEDNTSSSVLVEAGYALAFNKKSIFFFKEGVKIPYMLEGATNARKNFKIYSYKDFNDIEMIIKNNKEKLFDFS